jgi:hypothetical protein
MSSMTMTRALLMLCMAVFWQSTLAEQYSVELMGRRMRSELDGQLVNDTDALEAKYYFAGGVDDSHGPYALAAFLDRASWLAAGINQDEGSPFLPVTGDTALQFSAEETRGNTIAGRYVLPASGWFAGASLYRADVDFPPSTLTARDEEIETDALFFGKYLSDALSLDFTWRSSTSKRRSAPLTSCQLPLLCFGPIDSDTTYEEYEARVFFVATPRRMTYTLAGRVTSNHAAVRLGPIVTAVPTLPFPSLPPLTYGGIVFINALPSPFSLGRRRIYALAGELFPTRKLGVRLAYQRWDGDPITEERWDASTTWFFRRDFALRFAYGTTHQAAPIPRLSKIETAELALVGRF